MEAHHSSTPSPIVAIHVLAAVGVLFWLTRVIKAFADQEHQLLVVILAVVLGGAHVAMSALTAVHSRAVIGAMLFVLIGDLLLAIFVNWQAILLVGFTIVLLLLTRPASARAWFASAPTA